MLKRESNECAQRVVKYVVRFIGVLARRVPVVYKHQSSNYNALRYALSYPMSPVPRLTLTPGTPRRAAAREGAGKAVGGRQDCCPLTVQSSVVQKPTDRPNSPYTEI